MEKEYGDRLKNFGRRGFSALAVQFNDIANPPAHGQATNLKRSKIVGLISKNARARGSALSALLAQFISGIYLEQ